MDQLPDWASSETLKSDIMRTASLMSSDAASRRDIQPLDADRRQDAVFLVPARVRSDGKMESILLRVNGLGPLGSRPVAMLSCIVALAIALIALIAGFRGSREVAEREQLLGRLRSLQRAVLQTDGRDRITAANDRAEELMARALPTFGLEGGPTPPVFWDIFEHRSVLIETRTAHGSIELCPGNESVIRSSRELGNTTSYYVRLKSARPQAARSTLGGSEVVGQFVDASLIWLRVTAGPILRPPRTMSLLQRMMGVRAGADVVPETFGVVEPVPASRDAELDAKVPPPTTTELQEG
jgi:hypothetical protein